MSRRDVYTAIADPTRRVLLETLRVQGPLNAGQLSASVASISRPGVSRHLRVLRECGLLLVTRAGKEQQYSLNWEPLEEVRNGWLAQFARQQTRSIALLRRKVEPS